MSKIASNIKLLAERRGLKQAQLGKAAGVDQSTVSRILKTETSNPGYQTVQKLAEFFGVGMDDLVNRDLLEGETPSQPVGSEQEIVEAAVRLVRELEAMSPEPQPEDTYAERLYVAMKIVRDEGAAGVLDESALVPTLRRFAAELRKTG